MYGWEGWLYDSSNSAAIKLRIAQKTIDQSSRQSPSYNEIPIDLRGKMPVTKAKVANMSSNNASMAPMTKMAEHLIFLQLKEEALTRRRVQAKLLSQRRRKDRHLKYQCREGQFF